ncbi:unnamed protein product [Brachionus calyciflorus]|uniref:Uncharacterized protein n=1 Tax=Brachionus calyciflorus TaxID=104777 RepID=A0A813RAL5_9BILA|nr:unnamed protein product [Brachionus calyciflorus]
MIGMCALFNSVTPMVSNTEPMEDTSKINKVQGNSRVEKINFRKNRSISTAPGLYSYVTGPKQALERYLLGYHNKTKRSLAEEAECGDESSVNTWIQEGYDPDELDAYGYTPLLNASALGRHNAVVELIKNGANVNKKGPFGFTPLHAAAQGGHREVVIELLKNGADINSQNEDRDSPMHLALRSLQIEIVYMLLRNGGSSKIEGFMKKDCVQLAREYGLMDLARTLKNYNPSLGLHAHSAPDMKRRSVLL